MKRRGDKAPRKKVCRLERGEIKDIRYLRAGVDTLQWLASEGVPESDSSVLSSSSRGQDPMLYTHTHTDRQTDRQSEEKKRSASLNCKTILVERNGVHFTEVSNCTR